jgi:hypothetical protein
MARRFRRFLHGLVQYDALERRRRSLAIFFLAGIGALIVLGYIGVEATVAADLWFFLLIRLLIGLVIASLVLPFIWFLRRRAKLAQTPAGLLFLLLTAVLTILVFWYLGEAG